MSSLFDYPNVGVVSTFADLVAKPFEGQINAWCWQRELLGDFKEIVSQLTLDESVTEVSVNDLEALHLSPQGELARQTILQDLEHLSALGAAPVLNLIECYPRDDEFDFIATDVYSYHVDRSPIPTDTFLCTYHGAASDLLPNDQVQQKISIPSIRAQLRELYDGPEAGFEDFLSEYFFDLHYQALPHAHPLNLGIGYLWRLAVDHPLQQVAPCVHRAPVERAGEYRLLLIC